MANVVEGIAQPHVEYRARVGDVLHQLQNDFELGAA
jgi:hypothetical protein